MKHHIRKSEYQRQFSPINDDYFKASYEEQLDYRAKRREKENNGNFIFKWESESDVDTDSNSNIEGKENKMDEEIIKRLAGEEEDGEAGKEAEQQSTSKASQTSDQEEAPKPDTAKTTSSCRSKSRNKPPARAQSVEKPPFVSYGWADEQATTGRKRTHNVQAPKKTVYPAALQRRVYLATEKKRQKQKLLDRASSALANLPPLKKVSDSSEWQTEYQRCYSSMSSRPNTAQSKASKKSGRKSRLSTKRKVAKP